VSRSPGIRHPMFVNTNLPSRKGTKMAVNLDKEPKETKPKVAPKPDDSVILMNLYKKVSRIDKTIRESVVNVYADRYRVNIWKSIENDFIPNAGFIAASYFLVADKDGSVTILGGS
jgi:hypothetical protein